MNTWGQKILYTHKQAVSQTGWQRRSSVRALCSFLQRSSSSLDVPLSCNTLWSSARVRSERWDSYHQMDGGWKKKHDTATAKKFPLVKMAPKSPDKDAETIVFIKEMAKLLPPSLEKFKIPLLCFMDLSITLGFSSKSGSEDRYLPNPRVSLGNGIWQLHSYWKLQSLDLSFCKMCCWPTLVSLWTTFESWPEFWRMMVFH